MKNLPRATAVIPVWNRRDLLAPLFASLRAQTAPFAEIVVVDNGSSDGAAEECERLGARVLRMGANRGFAVAVNAGVAASESEFVAVLNNDVEISPGWLESLAEAIEAHGVWFATGKILDWTERDRIDATRDLMSRAGCALRAGHGERNGPRFGKLLPVALCPFTAILFRRKLFAEVGGLEERFESYLEDVEFGLRCALAGLGGIYVPGVLAWHRGSATLGRWNPETVRRISRNQVFLVAKHYPEPLLRKWWWPLFVGQVLWGLVAARQRCLGAWLRGKLEGWWRKEEFARGGAQRPEVEAVVIALEAEIAALREIRHSGYWRNYFRLCGGLPPGTGNN